MYMFVACFWFLGSWVRFVCGRVIYPLLVALHTVVSRLISLTFSLSDGAYCNAISREDAYGSLFVRVTHVSFVFRHNYFSL